MQPDPTFVQKRAPALTAIIVVKVAKAVLFLLVGLAFFSLVGQDLDAQFDRFLRWVHLNPEWRFLDWLGNQFQKITPASMRWTAEGFLFYSLLLVVESAGLIRRSWWSVWLAIGEAAVLIPLEVFELKRGFSWYLAVLLVLNILIVGYLVKNRHRLFRHHHPHHDESKTLGGPSVEI